MYKWHACPGSCTGDEVWLFLFLSTCGHYNHKGGLCTHTCTHWKRALHPEQMALHTGKRALHPGKRAVHTKQRVIAHIRHAAKLVTLRVCALPSRKFEQNPYKRALHPDTSGHCTQDSGRCAQACGHCFPVGLQTGGPCTQRMHSNSVSSKIMAKSLCATLFFQSIGLEY